MAYVRTLRIHTKAHRATIKPFVLRCNPFPIVVQICNLDQYMQWPIYAVAVAVTIFEF
jgi:hypothetical protein